METTHIVIMKVSRRSGTSYYHFDANYSVNQVAGKIAFGFMKVADTLEESDINLFLLPESNQIMIYDHGSSYEGNITRIGKVDGDPYYAVLNDGAKVEFSINSIPVYTAQEDYEEDDYDEEEDVPVAHIDGGHLEFNNIPIDGILEEFCEQLDGYELVSADEESRIYTGKYAGRPATLFIFANPETGMVFRVIVELQKWNLDGTVNISDIIRKDYSKILKSLKRKYGEEYADEQYDFDDDSAGDPDYESAFMDELADGDSYVGATFQFESDESEWYSKVTIYLEVDQEEDEDGDDSGNWYGCVNIAFVDGENEPFPEDDEDEDDE